jgi:hypothetical protein
MSAFELLISLAREVCSCYFTGQLFCFPNFSFLEMSVIRLALFTRLG